MSTSATSPLTDPGAQHTLLADLPTAIPDLCRVVHGCMIHIFHAYRYGFDPSEERKQEVQLRHIAWMLARLRELDDRPLTATRSPETPAPACREGAGGGAVYRVRMLQNEQPTPKDALRGVFTLPLFSGGIKQYRSERRIA